MILTFLDDKDDCDNDIFSTDILLSVDKEESILSASGIIIIMFTCYNSIFNYTDPLIL